MNQFSELQGILDRTGASIARASAAVVVPGFGRYVPFSYDLNVLKRNQAVLQNALNASQQQQQSINLGFPVLIAGGVVAVSAIGGWIYKHFKDSKDLETKVDVYKGLKDDGTNPERAAQLAFGVGTDWAKMTRNLVLLAAIGAGFYLFIKLR